MEFIQITLFFHAFFDEAEKKNSNGSTSKFILYVKTRLHAKLGACIRPPGTINTLSDLTKCLSQYIQFRVVDMDIWKLLGYVQITITNTITIYLTSSMKKGNKSLLGKQTNKYLQPSQYVPVLFPILLHSLPLQSEYLLTLHQSVAQNQCDNFVTLYSRDRRRVPPRSVTEIAQKSPFLNVNWSIR